LIEISFLALLIRRPQVRILPGAPPQKTPPFSPQNGAGTMKFLRNYNLPEVITQCLTDDRTGPGFEPSLLRHAQKEKVSCWIIHGKKYSLY
jgi:hypothetical protein